MSASLPAVSVPTAAAQATALAVPLEQIAEHLSAPQNEALAALVAGKTVKDAAEIAGIHRATLHRWITTEPLFRAAYNAWQHEARESSKARLLSVAQTALDSVAQTIQAGNPRLAYNLLKDLGLLSKLKEGLTDPELLRQQIERERDTLRNDLTARPKTPPAAPTPKP